MGDLQLTKEFKEATAAISSDILQNPQKYKQAGEWLDQYFDDDLSWQKMLKSSERIINNWFPHSDSDGGLSFLLPNKDDDRIRTIKQLVQAVAAIEFGKFLQLSEVYLTENEMETLERDFTKERFIELSSKPPGGLCEKCQKKKAIPSKYKLWLAFKEMLEIKEKCKFIGQEESMIVCLLTWLLANPDANRAALGITEFERWEWYSLHKGKVCPQRADVIQLLHTRENLQDWQNLACEAWQRIRSIDGKTERCEQVTAAEATKSKTLMETGISREIESGRPVETHEKKAKLTVKDVINQLWDLQNALCDYSDNDLEDCYKKWSEDADEKHFEPALISFTKILSDANIVRENLKTIQHLLPPESGIMNIIDQLCKSLEETQKEVIETQEKMKSLKGLSDDELFTIDYEYPMERLHEGFWRAYDCMDDDLGTHILCLENYFLKEQVESNPTETKRVNSPYLSVTYLIKYFNIPESQGGKFRKKIERSRNNKEFGGGFFREIANPRVNEPKYEYKTEKVALIVEEMKKKNVQRVSNEKKKGKI